MSRSFDGTGDEISIGNTTEHDCMTAWTVHSWDKLDTTTGDRVIIGNWTTNEITFFFDDVASASGRTNIWHMFISSHRIEGANCSAVACVWQSVTSSYLAGNNLELWVDGVEDANSPTDVTTSTDSGLTTDLVIGALPAGGRVFSGFLSSIVWWDVELNDNEKIALANGVNPIAIRPNNIISLWPLWGNQSPEPDWSGNGNTGTNTGSVKGNDGPPMELMENYL